MSWLSITRLPRPHDSERQSVAWTRWKERAAPPDDATGVALLDALFGNSPYLTETALQNPDFMTDLWRHGPDAALDGLMAQLAATHDEARSGTRPEAIAATLRRLKRRVALTVAVADIAGAWPLDRVTGALSSFASGCLDALTDSILLQLARDGQLGIGNDPQAAAFTVLGMGKLGAGELNYSSDIDLILLYDRDAPAVVTLTRPRGYFGIPRDEIELDGLSPPAGIPAGVAGVSTAKARLADAGERAVAGAFNGERIVGRSWPTAGNHVVFLELHD